MAASSKNARRSTCDFDGDSCVTQRRSQRKGAISSNDAGNRMIRGSNEGKKVEEVGVNGRRWEESGDEAIRCLCACREEKGEMVCCDMCEGWSHLSCIGVKEGVGVMEGKEFVCYFCMSACLLALRREVTWVKEELHSAKVELKGVKEENGRLKDEVEKVRSEKLGATQAKVAGSMTGCEMVVGDRSKGAVRLEKGEKQADCQHQASGSDNIESQQENEESTLRHGLKTNLKRSSRWAAGVRKVWGTRKSESGNEVAREMIRAVGRMSSGFSVMKRVAQLNGKKGWWFLVKAPERCLLEVDKKWKHKHWQWQKVHGEGSDFLGVAHCTIHRMEHYFHYF